ncbi:MAG TPA: peptide chain release factor N(5)-glutamine methyltransferase [Bacillota bacterium]
MRALTVDFVLRSTAAFLGEKGLSSARLEAELLLAFVLGLDRLQLYLQFDRPITPKETADYKSVIKRRLSGEPLAYITGKKSFLKWDFLVNSSVLIPRPETELLVERTCGLVRTRQQTETPTEATSATGEGGERRLLELGTGSGVIAISLALYLPEVRIDAVDVSPQAVAVAVENARRLGVVERITFYTGDLFAPLPKAKRYMGIVSNPPYIPTAVLATLSKEVRTEPVIALDGGADGLDFYRRIIPSAGEYLEADGFLAFEHGYDQAASISDLAKQAGYAKVDSYKDAAGYDRVLICSRTAIT